MKNKLKYYLKFGILYFGIPFLLWNCESENVDTGQQPIIETVPVNEAIVFFTVETTSKPTKTAKKDYTLQSHGFAIREAKGQLYL